MDNYIVYIVLHIITFYTLKIELPYMVIAQLEASKLSHRFVGSESWGNDHPRRRARRDCSRSNASSKTRLRIAFCTEFLDE